MHFYPYYLYEKNEVNDLCSVSLSIQAVLTQSGRVCFAVLSDCKNVNCDVSSYASSCLVKELTAWFWEKGIELAEANHDTLHNGMLRVLHGISEGLHKSIRYESEKFFPDFACVMIIGKRFYVWSYGDINLFLLQQKYGNTKIKNILDNRYGNQNGMIGKNRCGLYHTAGRVRSGSVLFFCNPIISGFFDAAKIKNLLQTGREHTKTDKRLQEIKYRIQKKGQLNDLGAICIVIEK